MMTEVPVNSEEEYYVDESFEEDTQSEVEEEQEIYNEDDDYSEDEVQKHHIVLEEETDSQSESDPEAEFMRGNVSEGKDLSEVTIKEFSLDPKNNVIPNPQPHARRHQLFSGSSNSGFNQKRMLNYPNSSSEDESQVVVTKTVAEVNHLVGVIRVQDEDESLSDRTLKPGSAHKNFTEDTDEDEMVEMEEVEEEQEIDQNDDDDAESVDEEEQRDAESDEDQKLEYEESDDEDQKPEYEESDDEDEDEDQYSDADEDPVIEMKRPLPQEDTVTVVDASDNSSDQSGPICKIKNAFDSISLYSTGNDTDYTVVEDRPPRRPSGIPISRTSNLSTRLQMDAQPVEPLDNEEPIKPDPQQTIFEEPMMQEMNPLPQLEDFLNDGTIKPNAASVKYLEQKMTQMSEMIMNSFRMSGGSTKNPALEQLAMATGMMQAHASSLSTVDEFESISTIGSSVSNSSRNCGDKRGRGAAHLRNSQDNLTTLRSSKLIRPKCRCPSETGSLEMGQMEPEMEPELDPFLMDECGQGDGLMRHHPHRRRQQNDLGSHFVSATPSSCSVRRDGASAGTFTNSVNRPRSSTEKVNKKNLGRKSFSFTNYQVREIERQNHILLKKMMSIKPTATIKASTSNIKCSPNAPPKPTPPVARLSSAAVNRRKSQRQIDLDNDVLKRKLEAIGSRRSQFK